MTKQEKERIRELAAQLRDISKELNYIIRGGTKYDLLTQGDLAKKVSDGIRTVGMTH